MRALGWAGIAAGTLLAMAGFALLIFMNFPSETSIWNASSGRWDDYLLVLACFGFGALMSRDRVAGWPVRTRNRALVQADSAERAQRINGCMVFFVGMGLLALVVVMATGSVVASDGRALGSLIVAIWALPLLWVMRTGWRRFSGQGWLGGNGRAQ